MCRCTYEQCVLKNLSVIVTNVLLLEEDDREKVTLHMPCALHLFPERLILTSVRDRILW